MTPLLLALALAASPPPAAHQPAHHRSGVVLRDFQRANPCPANGRTYGPCPGYVKDHRIPLCAGGLDRVDNLNWQTVADAKAKDVGERRECAGLRRARLR